MAEHGMKDARWTRKTHGISAPLPEGHKTRPDPRRNTKRTKGQRGALLPLPEELASVTTTGLRGPYPGENTDNPGTDRDVWNPPADITPRPKKNSS